MRRTLNPVLQGIIIYIFLILGFLELFSYVCCAMPTASNDFIFVAKISIVFTPPPKFLYMKNLTNFLIATMLFGISVKASAHTTCEKHCIGSAPQPVVQSSLKKHLAVDIQNFFNESLPAAMAKNPDNFRKIAGTYLFNITGEGGGKWFVDLNQPSTTVWNSGNPEITITMASEDFQLFFNNPQVYGMHFMFEDKMQIKGNAELLGRVSKIFELSQQ